MNYVAQRIVYGHAYLLSVLAANNTRPAGALVVTPKLRLVTDPSYLPTSDMTLASLEAVEADFSGYTPGGYALTYTEPVILGGDTWGAIATAVAEVATADPLVGNALYGYWVDDGTNPIVMERFGTLNPFAMGTVGAFLSILTALPFPSGQDTGMAA